MSHPSRSSTVLAIMLLLTLGMVGTRLGEAASPTVTTPPAALDATPSPARVEEVAVLAGGCFWGLEAVFEHVKGVTHVTSGYAGGTAKDPGYEEVSSGTTGHAESVRITFDPAQVSYGQLLRVFFSVAHDPTQLNRQGPDRGTQYRSAIFYTSAEQRRVAEAYIAQLERARTFDKPIVTQVAPLGQFFSAEDYHQDYALHHPNQPYIVINDAPKVDHLRERLPELWREQRAP